MAAANDDVRVIIYLRDEAFEVVIARSATIAQLRSAWLLQTGSAASAALFTPDQRCHLPDDWTLARAQQEAGGRRVMELQAVPRAAFPLHLFGFDVATVFEAAPHLTPAALRDEMAEALGLPCSDFRLFADNEEVDQNTPFSEVPEGAQLLMDPEVLVRITSRRADSEEATADTATASCFASTTVGDLRRLQRLPDAMALVAERPLRLLHDSTRIAHLADSAIALAAPIELIAERSQPVFFQPAALQNLRQEVPIPLSATPLDLVDVLRARFQMATEFRLVADGQPLDTLVPLVQQGIAAGSVIELDPERPHSVEDSTSLGDIVENDSTEDPLKVVLHDKKRLRICRLPAEPTFADLHAQFRAWRGGEASSPVDGRQRRVDLPSMSLVHLNKVGTRVEVQLDQRTYHCWFEQPAVTFSDVVVKIARQAEVVPRQLFGKQLFCRGCGRRVTRDEEEFQAVPSGCCRVRSLKLSDRRLRDAASQTPVRRSRLAGIEPLDAPQIRAESVSVGSSYNTVTVKASFARRRTIAKATTKTRTRLVTASSKRRRAVVDVGSSRNTRLVNASSNRRRFVVNVGSSYNTEAVSASSACHRAVMNAGSSYNTQTVSAFSDHNNDEKDAESVPVQDVLRALGIMMPFDNANLVTHDLESSRANVATGGDSSGDNREADDLESSRANVATGGDSPREHWMTATANWLRRSLPTARPAEPEEELVQPPRSLSLLMLVSKDPCGGAEATVVQPRDGFKVKWILDVVKGINRAIEIGDSAVIHVNECLINGQRFVQCFDRAKDKMVLVNLEGGKPAEIQLLHAISKSFLIHRFLFATSALPNSPLHIPVVFIFSDMLLLQVTADRRLEAASPAAMQDPAFVAYLQGVQCRNQMNKIFWSIGRGFVLDSLTGVIYRSMIDVPFFDLLSFVTCLLRRGDRPPYCSVPPGVTLPVYRRHGLQLTIERGRLQAPRPSQWNDMERWVTTAKVNQFDEDFTACARRK